MDVPKFSAIDYTVCAIMLAISAAIGVYYAFFGTKQRTTSEFLMGGRSLKVFPVALSVLASFMSAITLLGTPAEIYQYGTQYWVIIFGYVLLIPATAHLYIPIFHKLEMISVYEYLELRFSRVVRTLGSLTFALHMLLYMAVVLYAPSLALAQVTGLGVWLSVTSIGLVCTFYTSVGGIKAVVVTDVFQVSMMFASMFVVVFKGASDVGGWEYVWKTNVEGQRIEFFNFDTNPTTRHTVWSLVIGGYFTWLSIYGVNQAMVQRYLAIPTLKGAQRAIWINLPALSVLLTITSLAGLVIFAKYHDCDPKTSNAIQAPDQLLPLFVMETLGSFPGLPGLFVAGIFSGALSTVSSGVNSLAAVTLEDLVKVYIKPNISELWATRLTKIMAVCYGVMAIVLVAIAQQLGNVLQAALSLFGMIGGPLLGLFTLGMFFPWANSKGGVCGLLSGLIVSFWIGFGAVIYKPQYPKPPVSVAGCFVSTSYNSSVDILNSTNQLYNLENSLTTVIDDTAPIDEISDPFVELYRLSYMWYSATGFAVVIVVGLLVSFFTGLTRPEEIDPKLICPVFDILCPYLPKSVRRKLRFNVGADFERELEKKQPPKSTTCFNGSAGPHDNLAYEDEKGVCTRF